MKIMREMAFDIWKILVDRAGASDDMAHQDAFIYYATGHEEIQEYRFMGHLGMGGKVQIKPEQWKVFCHDEDLNDLRRTIIANTNHALAELKRAYEEE